VALRLNLLTKAAMSSTTAGKVTAASGDEFIAKVVNSNMPHAVKRAMERAGFSTVQEARLALQQFGKQLKEAGTLPATAVKDTAYHRVIIPGFGQGGAVVYQVRQGVLKLKTVMEWRQP
jgi:enamine deaminase RidA (YjgF/YER057c/UK114 family)